MTIRVTGSFSIPADNNALAAGDAISNSATGSAVVPVTFSPDALAGRITGCRCVVAPASGNLVITNLTFDLLLFRAATDIPFAAGSYIAHNSALAISAAARREQVAKFSFVAAAWESPAGSLTVAGVNGYQESASASRLFAPFNVNGLSGRSLLGLVQAQAAWNAANVVNRFDFALDVEV